MRLRCKEEEIDEKEEPAIEVSAAVVRAAEATAAAAEELLSLFAVPEAAADPIQVFQCAGEQKRNARSTT